MSKKEGKGKNEEAEKEEKKMVFCFDCLNRLPRPIISGYICLAIRQKVKYTPEMEEVTYAKCKKANKYNNCGLFERRPGR